MKHTDNPYAVFDYMGAFFLRCGFVHVDNVITKTFSKQARGCSCQACKATNHIGTLRNLPNPASGTHTTTHRTLRNFPEPASGTYQHTIGTYTSTHWNPPKSSGHQHAPEPSELPDLPPEPATHRNPSEPSGNLPGTCLRNLHQHAPELSGTFLRHTPELIWAEDPIGLCCWGKRYIKQDWSTGIHFFQLHLPYWFA